MSANNAYPYHDILEEIDMAVSYTYWKEPDGWLLGYFDAWPEHITQGKTLEELEFMLRDLYDLMELGKDERFKTEPPQRGELVLA